MVDNSFSKHWNALFGIFQWDYKKRLYNYLFACSELVLSTNRQTSSIETMKTKLTMLVAVAGFMLTACNTVDSQKFCADYEKDYKTYVELIGSGIVPDPKVVASAKLAAAFLQSYCGWTGSQTREISPKPAVDAYGVLVVWPPR